MATYGSIEKFNCQSNDSIDKYLEVLECYFAAIKIAEVGQQRVILLSVVGKETYHLIWNLCAPVNPSS